MTIKNLTITRPDDWHVHFRDGDKLPHTVTATANHFARALVMPNLVPPLTTVESLIAYQQRILSIKTKHAFLPFMTFYLNESLTIEELEKAKNHPQILGAKLYPAGATTNTEQGASSIKALYPILEAMQALGLVLQIHGEIAAGDIFEREKQFITHYLAPICKNFPKLRVVLEHISTACAVEFVTQASENVAATITAHHLMFNRNKLLAGGIRPHYYCLPILKSEKDQLAIQQAAVSGNPKFFAGTDSAPHAIPNKESSCGCAGIYTAPVAVTMYAEIFESLGKIHALNAFLSHHGASYYHQPVNTQEIELIKQPQQVPKTLSFGEEVIVPVLAGESLSWSIYES